MIIYKKKQLCKSLLEKNKNLANLFLLMPNFIS